MITVASGVFTAVDTVDAAVRAAIKNKGVNAKFFVDFAVRINVVGVGRFVVACKADAKLVTEDIIEAKSKRDKAEKEYEKLIADLKCLSLDYEQMRVLYSIENLILIDDISSTKKADVRCAKEKWKHAWCEQLLMSMPIVDSAKSDFFLAEDAVANYLSSHDSGPWKYLIAMEAVLFKPYYPIFGNDEDKAFKKLNCCSKYLVSHFASVQTALSKDDIVSFEKAYKQSVATITGSTQSIVIGAVGTTAVVLASGGLAFAFAPAIATALVGEAAAGLSGAALVSYSLAAIGGGSLAAGGLGMAGGTAIITGGGALVGLLGGTGVSTATTLNLLADDGYVLSECCKLLTFSNAVLVTRYHDIETVSDIQMEISGRIDALQQELQQIHKKDDSKGKEKKLKAKIAKKSTKYLKNTSDALEKLIKKSKKAVQKKPTLPASKD